MDLDQTVVWLTTYERFAMLYPYNVGDVLPNISLINATNSDIDKIIQLYADKRSMEIRPYNLQNAVINEYKTSNQLISFYSVLYGCEGLLILLGLVMNVHLMMNRNMNEYAIHCLYGATLISQFACILVFLLMTLLVPLLIFPVLLATTIFSGTLSISTLVAVFAFFVFLLSLPTAIKLIKNNPLLLFRSDI